MSKKNKKIIFEISYSRIRWIIDDDAVGDNFHVRFEIDLTIRHLKEAYRANTGHIDIDGIVDVLAGAKVRRRAPIKLDAFGNHSSISAVQFNG